MPSTQPVCLTPRLSTCSLVGFPSAGQASAPSGATEVWVERTAATASGSNRLRRTDWLMAPPVTGSRKRGDRRVYAVSKTVPLNDRDQSVWSSLRSKNSWERPSPIRAAHDDKGRNQAFRRLRVLWRNHRSTLGPARLEPGLGSKGLAPHLPRPAILPMSARHSVYLRRKI